MKGFVFFQYDARTIWWPQLQAICVIAPNYVCEHAYCEVPRSMPRGMRYIYHGGDTSSGPNRLVNMAEIIALGVHRWSSYHVGFPGIVTEYPTATRHI